MNMMSNALKFTNEGEISVKLSLMDIEKPVAPKEEDLSNSKIKQPEKIEEKVEGNQLKR